MSFSKTLNPFLLPHRCSNWQIQILKEKISKHCELPKDLDDYRLRIWTDKYWCLRSVMQGLYQEEKFLSQAAFSERAEETVKMFENVRQVEGTTEHSHQQRSDWKIKADGWARHAGSLAPFLSAFMSLFWTKWINNLTILCCVAGEWWKGIWLESSTAMSPTPESISIDLFDRSIHQMPSSFYKVKSVWIWIMEQDKFPIFLPQLLADVSTEPILKQRLINFKVGKPKWRITSEGQNLKEIFCAITFLIHAYTPRQQAWILKKMWHYDDQREPCKTLQPESKDDSWISNYFFKLVLDSMRQGWIAKKEAETERAAEPSKGDKNCLCSTKYKVTFFH